MPSEFGERVIDAADYRVVASTTCDGKPYCIPLSLVRSSSRLYFRSALEGTKVEVFREGSAVQVVFVGKVHIPELYTEMELMEMRDNESRGLELTRRVFTTEYESAIAHGTIREVVNDIEKTEALRLICEKYTPNRMDLFPIAIKTGISKVKFFAIEISDITAKRKKYDAQGKRDGIP